MRNQSYNSVVAPRAGFEPATNRLTAATSAVSRRFIPVHLLGKTPKDTGRSLDKPCHRITWGNIQEPTNLLPRCCPRRAPCDSPVARWNEPPLSPIASCGP
jgi:hypothetical protein